MVPSPGHVAALPWEAALTGTDRASRVRRIGDDFWTDLAATARDPTLAYLYPPGAADDDRPWGTLALVLAVLFASLGANLYIGWIAVDMYRRYLDLADDLLDGDSEPVEADEEPLEDDEDWAEFRHRRRRSTVAA